MNVMKPTNAAPGLSVSTGSAPTSAPAWKASSEMDECVTTSMSVQDQTSALPPPPVSTLPGRTTATAAEGSSLITLIALTWMSARQAAAARTQIARTHLDPSAVGACQGTGETASPVQMLMNACRPGSATPTPFAPTILAPLTALASWVILEMV